MHIIRIDEAFLVGLSKYGMHCMWLEVNDEGFVERELGFNAKGELVHRYPGTGRYGRHGVFDMNKFDVSSLGEDDIDPAEFEQVWR